MSARWLHLVRWHLALIGLLATAAATGLLALALAGYRASVGVLLIVAAVECCLYWLRRTQGRPAPKPGGFVPFREPTTVAR